MKVPKIAMGTICMVFLLAGCSNAFRETADVISENVIAEETKESETEEPSESLKEEENMPEEESGEESWLPDVTKDYKENEYMKYPISSVYFLEKDGYGYELVIAVQNEKEPDRKDIKIFVSKLEGEEYQL